MNAQDVLARYKKKPMGGKAEVLIPTQRFQPRTVTYSQFIHGAFLQYSKPVLAPSHIITRAPSNEMHRRECCCEDVTAVIGVFGAVTGWLAG